MLFCLPPFAARMSCNVMRNDTRRLWGGGRCNELNNINSGTTLRWMVIVCKYICVRTTCETSCLNIICPSPSAAEQSSGSSSIVSNLLMCVHVCVSVNENGCLMFISAALTWVCRACMLIIQLVRHSIYVWVGRKGSSVNCSGVLTCTDIGRRVFVS